MTASPRTASGSSTRRAKSWASAKPPHWMMKTMTSDPSSSELRAWRAISIGAMLPGLVHLLVLVVALAGLVEPAIWISGHLLDGPWSVPLLWTFVIGGPLLSVIASLMLELWPGKTRPVGTAFGMLAWALLIVGLVTTLPLPWILVFE